MKRAAHLRRAPRVTPHPISECFFFWALVGMSLAAFVPCILLPEWRSYEMLEIQRQREQHRLDVTRQALDAEKRLLSAIRNDPAVIDRIAQRELKYQRADEQVVRVAVATDGSTVPPDGTSPSVADRSFVPVQVKPPTPVARVVAILPDFDYDRIFCEERSRSFIMCISVALLAVAYALYGRRPPANERVRR